MRLPTGGWREVSNSGMFNAQQIVDTLVQADTTHVVWLPDSTTGQWEQAIESCESLKLVRVCREGEAWPLAAGLQVGGQSPVIIIQCTGLFESGDALRNVLFDLQVPLFAIIGARNWLIEGSGDSAKRFCLPILEAWGIPYQLIARPEDRPRLAAQLRECRARQQPGFAVLAEGRG